MAIIDWFKGTMARVLWPAIAALTFAVFCNAGHSQISGAPTAIAKFDDVAGKWVGYANNHSVSLGN